MTTLLTAGLPVVVLLVMFIFKMYTFRNLGWVLLCLLWGAVGYGVTHFLNPPLAALGLDALALTVVFTPLLQQVFVALGNYVIVRRARFDNIIDGAVYGFTTGLGYSVAGHLAASLASRANLDVVALLRAFSSTLVYATASGIVGVIVMQFHFSGRSNRITILLSGLGAGIGYLALFNFILLRKFGGDILPIAYGVGGLTLVGLYLTGQMRRILIQLGVEKKRADSLLNIVIPIGVQLSAEKNFSKLLEGILVEAKSFCNADGGTLYLVRENRLEFAVIRNDTLRMTMGGTSPVEIVLPGLHLYNEDGTPNHHNIAAYAALSAKTVNIEDAYAAKDFDFSGTRAFDRTNGYQSISFLTIPLKGAEEKVLGVLQLINALNSKREIIPFDKNLERLMESFSSLATAALEGYIQEQSLRNEIKAMRIQIDQSMRAKQVEEITDSDYFKNLQGLARKARHTLPAPKAETDDPTDKPASDR
ncbi:MAG: hypothetical protein HFACDABA_01785 [Anaerolineales bacterium]|nr:hypothetical protein [Anaerolineales bacterium]